MTHDELVGRAIKWLRNPSRGRGACGVAVPELVSFCSESPDAIGWVNGGVSTMIECKVSRSDFLADQKKPRQNNGVGSYRYYMCVPGLIKPDDMPPYWGLLYCHEKRVTVEVGAPVNEKRNVQGEMAMMYSLLRRVEVRGQLRPCLSSKWGGDGKVELKI
jgi:hypothetical protein